VYLGTGNASPDYWIGYRRPFDDRFGTSIVALDVASGKLRWSRQLVHHDMWDMDLPIGPSLFDYRAPDGRTIPALLQTTKMGQVYFLNRLTGAPIPRLPSDACGPTVRRPASLYRRRSLSRWACRPSPHPRRAKRPPGGRRRSTSCCAGSTSAARRGLGSTSRSG